MPRTVFGGITKTLLTRRAALAGALTLAVLATPASATANRPTPSTVTTERAPTVALAAPVQLGPPAPVRTTVRTSRATPRKAVRPRVRVQRRVVDVKPRPRPRSVTRSAATKPRQQTSRPARTTATGSTSTGSAATVIRFARAQLGKPYRWAAAGPGSYDCSGLVMAAFARVGIRLPHQTGGIIGRGRSVSRSAMRPGDIIFTGRGHVGIYVGNDRMIHAPKAGDVVRESTIWTFYAARRVL